MDSTTRTSTILVALALGAVAAYGCDSGPSNAEIFDADMDEYEMVLNTRINETCRCSDELGYETAEACRADQGEFVATSRECRREAYGHDFWTSVEYIDCMLPLARDYDVCVYNNLTCDDAEASTESCTNTWTTRHDRCDALPEDLQHRLDDCAD